MRSGQIVASDIPWRLDRLGWSGFHWLVVLALGITWILDGLEVTLAGAVAPALKASPQLHLTDMQVGASASAYLTGAVLGAVFFGWLADRLGRKRLFFITLGVYLAFTAATAFSSSFPMYALLRLLTGAGIGGEYAAINSAIQELVPARYRGRTDLAINGSFWLGAALGSVGASILLAPAVAAPDVGWRMLFGLGALIGLVVLAFRRKLPESPRWLLLRGRQAEAEEIVAAIEARARRPSQAEPAVKELRIAARRQASSLSDLTILSGGDSGVGYRGVLCIRHGVGWHRGPVGVRFPDRHWRSSSHCRGLRVRRGAHAGGRNRGGLAGDRRGTALPGRAGRAAFQRLNLAEGPPLQQQYQGGAQHPHRSNRSQRFQDHGVTSR